MTLYKSKINSDKTTVCHSDDFKIVVFRRLNSIVPDNTGSETRTGTCTEMIPNGPGSFCPSDVTNAVCTYTGLFQSSIGKLMFAESQKFEMSPHWIRTAQCIYCKNRMLTCFAPVRSDDSRRFPGEFVPRCPETSFVKPPPPLGILNRFCHRRVPLDVPTAAWILTR